MSQFVEKANLPNSMVKLCISADNICDIEIIKTQKCNDVYRDISYHPDIQMIYLGDGDIVISPNIYDKYIDIFKQVGLNCIKGNTFLKDKYPYDIAYNGCIIGEYFIHNLKYTDSVVKKIVDEKGLKCINVNQGYTKCNISIVDEHSAITSDAGIYSSLKDIMNVLYIEPDNNIHLEGMQGFIGGATGLISNDKWYINGDISNLRESKKVLQFLNERKINCVDKKGFEIFDIGSIILLKYE